MTTTRATDRHAGLSVGLALAVVGVGGGLSAGQSRINAELGERFGSALVAALVSFVLGLVLVCVLVAARPAGRRAVTRYASWGLPWWQYLGGLGGAFFVAVAAYAVPILGVALMSVAQVTGQIVGAMTADRLGLPPSGRQPVSWPRLLGAVLGVVAVVIATMGLPRGHLDVVTLALTVLAGFTLSVQVAVNGRVNLAAGDPLTATAVNFAVGTLVLLVLVGGQAALSGVDLAGAPHTWWFYLGGAFGVAFVTIGVVCVPVLGVLRLGLAAVAGQLAGALVLDAVVPGGPGVSVPMALGAVLTVVAVGVSGLRSSRWTHPRPGPTSADVD